jgi:hypothetical protein
MNRPWFAIVWFMIWGLFQAYAVASIFAGTWQKPENFPEEAYFSLIYPDMFFIPLYLLTAGLLLRRHWLGSGIRRWRWSYLRDDLLVGTFGTFGRSESHR